MPGVIYESVFFNGSGYATESRTFVRALVQAGVAVKMDPMDPVPQGEEAAAHADLLPLLHTPVNPAEALWIQANPIPWVKGRPPAARAVLRTMYETERIRPEWAAQCNLFDEVWLPSHQNVEAFVASGVRPEKVRLVPGGVDVRLFSPGASPLPLARHRGFAFLSVFAWQWRKGWDHLLRAYCEEFAAGEPVTLYLKVDPLDRRPEVAGEILHYIRHVLGRELADVPEIVLLDFPLTDGEMARLYAAVDAFVLPTRGEGYGRPFLEAMACGLPVIGTAWGGQADFLLEGVAYPVPVAGMVTAPDGDLHTFRGLRWAEPDGEALRRVMRHVFTHREEARAVGAAARRLVEAEWDAERIAAGLADRLRILRDGGR
ncbi:MAG: glycosyltransferase [Symbiobacterium sp.]|uniref:glycosyltransferase n=1 Tax=Symbiobacterium sp. TaxID=1971213 RepID=UPI003463EAF7